CLRRSNPRADSRTSARVAGGNQYALPESRQNSSRLVDFRFEQRALRRRLFGCEGVGPARLVGDGGGVVARFAGCRDFVRREPNASNSWPDRSDSGAPQIREIENWLYG